MTVSPARTPWKSCRSALSVPTWKHGHNSLPGTLKANALTGKRSTMETQLMMKTEWLHLTVIRPPFTCLICIQWWALLLTFQILSPSEGIKFEKQHQVNRNNVHLQIYPYSSEQLYGSDNFIFYLSRTHSRNGHHPLPQRFSRVTYTTPKLPTFHTIASCMIFTKDSLNIALSLIQPLKINSCLCVSDAESHTKQ